MQIIEHLLFQAALTTATVPMAWNAQGTIFAVPLVPQCSRPSSWTHKLAVDVRYVFAKALNSVVL
jgi:hypothetical protein